MPTFVLRRMVQAIPVIFLSTIIVFMMLRLIPGDSALILAGPDATEEGVAAVRHDLGLDKPLPVQYGIWLLNVAHGDFGRSVYSRLPVSKLVSQRLPATVELATTAMLLALVLGVGTGVLAAMKARGAVDWSISTFNAIVLSVPNFWQGILAIIVFALFLGWLPPGGRANFGRDPILAVKTLILPAAVLALDIGASLSRLVRASMLEVLREDYVRTARAKGLSERSVILHHVLRNALVPVVTIIGLQFGRLLGGAVVIEAVFAWPGLGTLLLDSIRRHDYAVVQSILLMLVITFTLVNVTIDILYALLDPRIRLTRSNS